MKYTKSHYCRNCHYPLPYKARFCAHCSQKDTDGRVPVQDLLQQLWFRLFHLESKFFRVLWRLFVPGQVSIDYFKGKQKRYPPPLQFFFVIMFFFLVALQHTGNNNGQLRVSPTDGTFYVGEAETPEKKANIYELAQRYAYLQEARQAFDSLPKQYQTQDVRWALDSIFRRTNGNTDNLFGSALPSGDTLQATLDTLDFNFFFARNVRIASLDLIRYEPAQLFRKYRITHWFDRLLVQQGLKTIKDPQSLMQAYIGSLAWTILVLTTVMAFVLTLLYWRQRRYYVEHFIFLLHRHSGDFLLLTLALTVHYFIPFESAWFYLLGWLVFSQFFSMYRYYGQGFVKTFFKWALFSFAYVFGFVFFFLIGVLVVFTIF